MHVHIDQRTLVVLQCNIILSNGFESHCNGKEDKLKLQDLIFMGLHIV